MKKIFFLAALLLGFTAMPALASEGNTEGKVLVKVTANEGKVLKINLANLQKVKTVVRLKDLKGNSFFSKVIRNHNGFRSFLDLNQLPKGRYILSVNHGDKLMSQVVVIGEEGMQLSAFSS